MRSGLFSVPTLEEQIESLQPGDHVCVISSGAAVVRSVIVPFVRRCLARKEMCFYATGERAVEDVVAELTQAGINVEQARERGALTLLSSREYMPLKKFDASAFLAVFRARARQAVNAGFSRAAFVVEMTWGLELEVAHDALIEWEARLNTEFFPTGARHRPLHLRATATFCGVSSSRAPQPSPGYRRGQAYIRSLLRTAGANRAAIRSGQGRLDDHPAGSLG